MKLLGAFLLFICSCSTGIYFALRNKKQLSDLKETINFLQYIKTRIVYFNSPLNNIYSGFTTDSHSFSAFLSELQNREMYSVLTEGAPLTMSKNTLDALKEMSKELGKTFKDKQEAMLDNCIALLEKEYREKKNDFPQTYKLYVSLGIYVGILLVILFL